MCAATAVTLVVVTAVLIRRSKEVDRNGLSPEPPAKFDAAHRPIGMDYLRYRQMTHRPQSRIQNLIGANNEWYSALPTLDQQAIGMFFQNQQGILRKLPACTACVADAERSSADKWVERVAEDFMRPYINSLMERAAGMQISDPGWADFFEQLDFGNFENQRTSVVGRVIIGLPSLQFEGLGVYLAPGGESWTYLRQHRAG